MYMCQNEAFSHLTSLDQSNEIKKGHFSHKLPHLKTMCLSDWIPPSIAQKNRRQSTPFSCFRWSSRPTTASLTEMRKTYLSILWCVPVDGIQVDCRFGFALAPREEHDAPNRWRHSVSQNTKSILSDVLCRVRGRYRLIMFMFWKQYLTSMYSFVSLSYRQFFEAIWVDKS